MKRVTQRDAVCMAFNLDRPECTEYQPTRHRRSGVIVFNVGDGYAVAIKPGRPFPEYFREWFEDQESGAEWKLALAIGGYNVFGLGV